MGFMKSALLVLATAVAVGYFLHFRKSPVPPDVQGFCSKKFEKVKEAFRENLESGLERGGAFAVYHKGELVCDLWGGYADEVTEYLWKEDSLGSLYSATKAASSLCVLMLSDRGLLNLEDPVAKYWPEFGQNGKQTITVTQLLSHQAGLAAIDETFSLRWMEEQPEKLSQILAAQTPNWTPGTRHGYHALTYGLYLNELIRRVDPQHRHLGDFFQQEVATPLDLDMYIGLPSSEYYRLTRLYPLSMFAGLLSAITIPGSRRLYYDIILQRDYILTRTFTNPNDGELHPACHLWPEYVRLHVGSFYGFSTARSLARLYGVLANGGKAGDFTLLSEKTLALYKVKVTSGEDRIIKDDVTWGYGVTHTDYPGGEHVVGHAGYGGQYGGAVLDKKLAWAYITSYPSFQLDENHPRHIALSNAVLKCV